MSKPNVEKQEFSLKNIIFISLCYIADILYMIFYLYISNTFYIKHNVAVLH